MLFSLLSLLLFTSLSFSQSLTGVKICIDPGHGGHESDDRYMAATGFWESESNLEKAFYLKDILEGLGATVILTRYGNDDDEDDPSLSERVAVANENNVDYFNSIHSNGYNGTHNSTLMLYRGYDNDPWFDDAKVMGEIMAIELYNAHRTSHWSNRGDWSFRPEWGTSGYGVLRGTDMPATISEGSHHDYLPESWRLMNSDYRKHEAWAIARSFLNYFKNEEFSFGEIAGIARDIEKNVDYYYLPESSDAGLPINNFKVTLQPGNLVYQGDQNNNGFFLFDKILPGSYTLYFEAEGYLKDSLKVSVTKNQTIFADIHLDPKAPGTPDNISVCWYGPGALKIDVEPTKRTTGYAVLISRDGINFTDSVMSSSAEIILNGLDNDSLYYFRVRSVNDSAMSPPNRHLLAAVPSINPSKVLIVNGFDRSTNTRGDYIREYTDPVMNSGYSFSYALNEAIESNRLSLSDYETVIWILGDESYHDTTLSLNEQRAIMSFLDNGGNLFITGSEIGYDLAENGGIPDNYFYRHYLKSKYLEDAPGGLPATYYKMEAIPYGLFDRIGVISYDDGSHGTIDVDYPDVMEGASGGVDVLAYQTGGDDIKSAGIAFEGIFPEGNKAGRLVHLSVPFETIYSPETRRAVMTRVMEFFEGRLAPLQIINEEKRIVNNFQLYQNYPNPFNPVTKIKFEISKTNMTTLIIYDAIGRKVEMLVNNRMDPGQYSIEFNGVKLASGMYYYVLKSGNHSMRRKMMLVK